MCVWTDNVNDALQTNSILPTHTPPLNANTPACV